MKSEEKQFWRALAEPIFTHHVCRSCKFFDAGRRSYDFCNVCEEVASNILDHPDNKWEWDGETMPDEDGKAR